MLGPAKFSHVPWLLCGCFLIYIILAKVTNFSTRVYHKDLKGTEGANSISFTETIGRHIQNFKGVTVSGTKGSHLRISCWIMTSPENLWSRSRFIQQTWAKRCDKVVFISSETNTSFPAVGINVFEGRNHLTQKTLGGFHYVYQHHLNDCDWFFKADDDTYAIIENMRHFLADYDPDQPIYFGHHFTTHVKQGYSSGGSGLVVSREALRRFGKEGNKTEICRQSGSGGDAAFGECMQNTGVPLGNSTDSLGRSRFHCFKPASHVTGGYPKWYYTYDANGAKQGIDNLSDYPISFHYIRGKDQLILEYMLYKAKVWNEANDV